MSIEEKLFFFYSYLNNCIKFKHSKMKMYNHLWTTVSMSFHVESQPASHFDVDNIKCSLVAKSQVSLDDPSIFTHTWRWVRSLRKHCVLFLVPSSVSGFSKKWIWLEDSTSIWTYKVSHLIFVSSRWCRKLFVDLKMEICLCRMPLLTTWSTCLYNQVSLSFLISG